MLKSVKSCSYCFENAGPNCLRMPCPEGKYSCGKPQKQVILMFKDTKTAEVIKTTKDNPKSNKNMGGQLRQCSIGGQAVLEGVMMRSKNFWSIAVRKPDGTISTNVFKAEPIAKKHKF